MAGIHSDRGDFAHKITSGEVPVVGLRVMTNDYRWGTIVALDTEFINYPCGYYCPAWHTIKHEDDGSTTTMNCERLTSRHY